MASSLSMQVVEGQQVAPNATSHSMCLSGLFVNQTRTAVRIRMTQAVGGSGVVAEATVRSTDASVADCIMGCLV